ncbi:hypothetical protein FRC01_003326 [Tulasnella sp. 417]|nr:hypothetical protein FRC01_003326 [Tulasnella sp. 417]
MRTRTAETRIVKVKAHSGVRGNEEADRLANLGSEGSPEGFPDLEVPQEWSLGGARLSSLSFREMYAWVRSTKKLDQTNGALRNLDKIKEHLRDEHNRIVTDGDIWLSLRRPYIRREISDFLWKMIHERSPCGTMFSNWGPGWEDLQYCECGAVESMEHIQMGCGPDIWKIRLWEEACTMMKASKIIEDKLITIRPTYESLMAVSVVKAKSPTATRLWATITSETAFTVWKLRNRRRFDGIRITARMAIDMWLSNMEKRARSDLAITRLKGTKTAPELKRTNEMHAAWTTIATWKSGMLYWIYADHG